MAVPFVLSATPVFFLLSFFFLNFFVVFLLFFFFFCFFKAIFWPGVEEGTLLLILRS